MYCDVDPCGMRRWPQQPHAIRKDLPHNVHFTPSRPRFFIRVNCYPFAYMEFNMRSLKYLLRLFHARVRCVLLPAGIVHCRPKKANIILSVPFKITSELEYGQEMPMNYSDTETHAL